MVSTAQLMNEHNKRYTEANKDAVPASDEPTKKTQQSAKKRKTKNALLWTDHQRRFNKPKILNEPKVDGIIMDVSERTMRQQ